MARVLKSVDVDPEVYEELRVLAKAYKLTNKELVSVMIQYFKKTKADPRNPKEDNPTDAIKALDRRIVSFIKTQEKDVLIPMKTILHELATTTDNGVSRLSHIRNLQDKLNLILDHFNL